jgi:acyl-CoA synthetase (AMP-forming)/AMP-acid ligase II
MMKLGTLLVANAKRHPHKTAVACDGEKRTFRELNERANRLANALIARGVRPADRVIVYLANGIELVEAMAGIMKMGAVIVPLSTRLTAGEVAHISSDCEPEAVIYSADLRPQVEAATTGKTGLIKLIVGATQAGEEAFTPFLESGPAHEPPLLSAHNDDLLIGYTSGTTGRPKGAVITHNNLILANGFMNTLEWELSSRDVILATTAMAHRTGLGRLANTFYLGCTLHMQAKFDAAACVDLIEREKVTVVGGVPTVYRMLAPVIEKRPEAARSLRLIVATGEVFPVPLKERLWKALPHVGIYSFLAQTESGFIAGLRPEEQKTKPGALGRPVPGVEVRIVDAEGHDVETGQAGEILVRCGTRGVGLILREYFRNPKATEEAFYGEWFRTGDVGYFDDEGFLYFADRAKDMIVSGGLNVYSKEVELTLAEHPAVEEAAVFGVPDAEFGEAVAACVVLKAKQHATPEALIEHCRARIASYKKPRHVHFVAELPKTGTGKIQKAELKKRFATA